MQAVLGKTVRVVRHRDVDAPSASGALPLEERREDLDHGVQRAPREVGDLHRRQRGRGVGEQACPALVVEVVSRAAVVRCKAGDRAVHDRFGDVAGADAETVGHARPEALEDDVGLRADRAPELGRTVEIPDDRFLPGVQRLVPAGRDVAHGISARCLDTDHACAALQQLAACEWAGKVAREVRDDDPGKRLHYAAYID